MLSIDCCAGISYGKRLIPPVPTVVEDQESDFDDDDDEDYMHSGE